VYWLYSYQTLQRALNRVGRRHRHLQPRALKLESSRLLQTPHQRTSHGDGRGQYAAVHGAFTGLTLRQAYGALGKHDAETRAQNI
jgi:hypothetical protein